MSDVRPAGQTLNLVQLLRGVASLLVVLLHTTGAVRDNFHTEFLGGFFDFGGSGVDIFFVLSGFIITYTSRKSLSSSGNFLSFLKRRFVRIYPVYWIIISALLVVQVVMPSFYRTHYEFTAPNLLSTYLLFPGHVMVNGVSWTLSYELFFYFLFSIAFLVRDKKALLIASIVFLCSIIVLTAAGIVTESSNPWLKLVFYPMNTEFFMGIAAALIIPKMSSKLSVPFIIAGSICFLAAGIASNNGYYIVANAFNRVIFFGIPSFFIITGIVSFELSRKVNLHSVLVSLGEASYTLYLVHLPLVTAGIKMLAKLNPGSGIILQGVVCAAVIIICAVSIFFYKLIEKPLIARLNKILK